MIHRSNLGAKHLKTLKPLAIISGGGTGMGAALALQLAQQGLKVLILGRRKEKLHSVSAQMPDLIQYKCMDIAVAEQRQALAEELGSEHIRYLVHHAASLDPVTAICNVSQESWRKTLAVNVEAPLFLNQLLLPLMQENSRVLNLSSAAAQSPMVNRAVYAASKAALLSLHKSFQLEYKDQTINFASVQPGIVNTEALQTSVAKHFPSANIQDTLKKQLGQALLEPDYVAKFLCWLLLQCGNESFEQKEWDIRDTWHHELWQKTA